MSKITVDQKTIRELLTDKKVRIFNTRLSDGRTHGRKSNAKLYGMMFFRLQYRMMIVTSLIVMMNIS
jgi:hypothetical protein